MTAAFVVIVGARYITRRRWRDRRPLRLRDRFVAKRLALAAFVMVVVDADNSVLFAAVRDAFELR
jgi:hypothetical protein